LFSLSEVEGIHNATKLIKDKAINRISKLPVCLEDPRENHKKLSGKICVPKKARNWYVGQSSTLAMNRPPGTCTGATCYVVRVLQQTLQIGGRRHTQVHEMAVTI
jgi:hypothetical protein